VDTLRAEAKSRAPPADLQDEEGDLTREEIVEEIPKRPEAASEQRKIEIKKS
jgi:hypothetical protein